MSGNFNSSSFWKAPSNPLAAFAFLFPLILLGKHPSKKRVT